MSAHVIERLGQFLDGEIPADERAAIASHLRECPACSRRLEELAAVDDVARSLTVEAPQGYFDDFPSRVRSRLRAPARRRFTPPAWTLAVAAALVLAVLTPLTLRQIQTAPSRGHAEVPAAATAVADKVPEEAKSQAAPATLAERPLAQAAPEAKKALKDAPAAASLEKRRSEEPGAPIEAPPPRPALAMAPASTPPQRKEEASHDERASAVGGFAGAPPDSREQDALRSKTTARGDAEVSQVAPQQRAGAEGGAAAARGLTANAAPSGGATELRYRALLARKASTPAEARSLREAWRAYAQSDPVGPLADEARVRTIEAGVAAYRLSGEVDDQTTLDRDAADYLTRPDAQQAPRVRALVASVKPN